jgi:hypothetical protein
MFLDSQSRCVSWFGAFKYRLRDQERVLAAGKLVKVWKVVVPSW